MPLALQRGSPTNQIELTKDAPQEIKREKAPPLISMMTCGVFSTRGLVNFEIEGGEGGLDARLNHRFTFLVSLQTVGSKIPPSVGYAP